MEEIEEQTRALEELRLENGGGGDELVTESRPSLEEVEKIIGYSFNDKCLLEQAFTDPSYKQGLNSYQRLEYVGDSVLSSVIATEHYLLYPELPQGKLTLLRSANVDTEKLARVAVQHGFLKYLRHKRPLLDGEVSEFIDEIPKYFLNSMGLIDVPKVLADIVESIIGAVHIDSNSSKEITSKVINNLVQPRITPATLQPRPVTKLTEICDKNKFNVRVVDLWKKTNEIEIYVANEFVGKGKHKVKKIALNRAADDAYNVIVGELNKNVTKC